MARKLQHRRLATTIFVTAALWTGLTATAAAQAPQSIPAGATSQVAVPTSNVLATCTPPAMFQPNPTKWSVAPTGVVLGNLPDAAAAPPAGHALHVSVPSYLAAGQTIVISWSGNTSCLSYNGSITLTVSGGSAPPPAGAPPPPVQAPPPIAPPVADSTGKIACGAMAIGGRQYRVFARGMTCEDARAILSGTATGWRCFGSRTSAGMLHYLCRRTGTPASKSTGWTISLPPGSERCAPVKYGGRFWDVYKRAVLCRYARNTALRALRNDSPIIYEFTNPSQGFHGRWSCRRYGAGSGRYGICHKVVENRLVAWMPSTRRR